MVPQEIDTENCFEKEQWSIHIGIWHLRIRKLDLRKKQEMWIMEPLSSTLCFKDIRQRDSHPFNAELDSEVRGKKYIARSGGS